MKIYEQNWFWLLLAIGVFLVNHLICIENAYEISVDEAWYGNTAYNFAQGRGFLNTVIGSRGNSNFLFPAVVGIFMRIFGYSLLSIRLTVVFSGVLTLFFIYLAFSKMRISWKACALTFFFFVSIEMFHSVYKIGRPEGTAMMCLAGGIWMYLRYKESCSWSDMVGMSIFAYLAAVAHPYALLSFALMGTVLLKEAIGQKKWNSLAQLILLMCAAIAALLSIQYVSDVYNIPGEDYVQTRFSSQNIAHAIPMYYKSIFFNKKVGVSILFLICALLMLIWKKNPHKDLATIAMLHFLLFPVLFTTGDTMITLGKYYFILIAVISLAVWWDMVEYNKIKVSLFVLYCVFNLSVANYYKYFKYYECANTVLGQDLPQIIPHDAKVFGPLRQWPFLMETDYQAEHSVLPMCKQEEYDYIVLSSCDMPKISNYKGVLPINEAMMSLIYTKETRQYGLIQVYRNNRYNNQH